MAKGSYATKQILNWMEYFSKEMQVSPEKIKLLDICGKQKNVIPTVEGHKRVLIFADESHEDLFYDFWEAGFGDYDMWYAVGIEEEGQVKHVKIKEVINRKITGPTVIFILNEKTRAIAPRRCIFSGALVTMESSATVFSSPSSR